MALFRACKSAAVFTVALDIPPIEATRAEKMDAKSVQVDYSEEGMQIERPGDSGAGRNGEAAVAFRKAMALSLLVVTALFLGKMLVCRHEVTTTPIIWAAPDDLSSFNPDYDEPLKFGRGHDPQANFTWDITHFKNRAIGGELLYFLSIAQQREDGSTYCLRLHSLSLTDHIWAYYTMTTYDYEVPQVANVLLRIVSWNDQQDKIYGPYQCAFMGDDDKGLGCHFVILSAMKAFELVDANGTLSIDIFATPVA